MQGFSVRSIIEANELQLVIDLQRLVYTDDAPNLLPHHVLVDLASNGGKILGAFDEHDQLVGYLISFLGLHSLEPSRPAIVNLKLILERIVVHPDYRGIGIAYKLASRLREYMQKQGIRLATHVFDPLDSRSAQLAVGKLGSIARLYIANYYGSQMRMSDRVIAEWWVTTNRVEERIEGKRGRLGLAQYLDAETPILNPTHADEQLVYPYEHPIMIPSDRQMMLLEIPHNMPSIRRTDEALARLWKEHIGDGLNTILSADYVITDFLFEEYEGRERAFYLMSFDGPQFTLQL